VTEDEACEQVAADDIINFPMSVIPPGEECKTYKWHIIVEGYSVDVTINYLNLDEAAGDYLVISPGK
jgi:hypothetical protein